jgi:7,8-dihydropterin-6-yl-methyl-4-(beta-D-ribofuranosyl)aminobenzene 5'-phosphate synthase
MLRLPVLARLAAVMLAFGAAAGAHAAGAKVTALRITVLSTMLADRGVGEWGYAALVEANGKRILFDTGARPETVLRNAQELGVDLSSVEEVVLSHNHRDHTGGLVTLRRELAKKNPAALSRAHVAEGIFLARPREQGRDANGLAESAAEYRGLGGRFIVHSKPVQLLPGVWLTGPVPRKHPERNYPGTGVLRNLKADVPDNIPEDASLLFRTDAGIVVLTGCGHAGIVNISDHARDILGAVPVVAVVGGLHLFDASDETLAWTAAQLKARGIRYLLAGHCTGIEATFVLRRLAGLDRKTAVVSSVGSSLDPKKGIEPLLLAR